MKCPPVPEPVVGVLSRHREPVRARLLEIRTIILVAADTEGVGPLTETLKWGDPAYLIEASKSGTAIRPGTTKLLPENCAVLFNCKTTLVETICTHFADDFVFEGNRALLVPTTGMLPHEPRCSACVRR